ncbi:MAG: phospholipase D-like domain-containing protein [Myxococcota bacterium]
MTDFWFNAFGPSVLGWAVGGFALLVSVVATGHAVLHKREERAAIGWVGVIWLAPLIGAFLYLLFGINRIRRTAHRVRGPRPPLELAPPPVVALPEAPPGLAQLLDQVGRFPLRLGHRIEPLVDGDEAYPAMLEAIGSASRTLGFSSYIFDRDPTGHRFVEALAAAQARGCQVRVLVDDAGLRYSFPSVLMDLRRAGVPTARFMKVGLRTGRYFNLRTHRKILLVDGELAFTGGINIRQGHVVGRPPSPGPQKARDLHFRVEGPAVAQLGQVFLEDWNFASGEELSSDEWVGAGSPIEGGHPARVISDGPDEDFDQLRWAFLGGLTTAQHKVQILTPYFLPDDALQTALIATARRGVQVDVLLPERGNLPFVQWAMWARLRDVAETCRVWVSPPPFDHSKLMLVDDAWVLLGSGNWDPRSFRLNFELQVEAYDSALAERMAGIFEARQKTARRLTTADLDARSLAVRLRDGFAHLFSPYL